MFNIMCVRGVVLVSVCVCVHTVVGLRGTGGRLVSVGVSCLSANIIK